MASIKCAHCTETHDSVAAVRACALGTGTVVTRTTGVTLPDVGSVVTLSGERGYWEVSDLDLSSDSGRVYVKGLAKDAGTRWAHHSEITQSWTDLTALANHVMNQKTETRPAPRPQPPAHGAVSWARVNELRGQAKDLLVREERGKLVGYFAVLALEGDAKVKFYRLRTPLRGKWAGYLFVDAQASGDFYPVRQAGTLVSVLEGILADPQAAGLLYATELGQCCRCARTLTDETSRARGIGPECFKKG